MARDGGLVDAGDSARLVHVVDEVAEVSVVVHLAVLHGCGRGRGFICDDAGRKRSRTCLAACIKLVGPVITCAFRHSTDIKIPIKERT